MGGNGGAGMLRRYDGGGRREGSNPSMNRPEGGGTAGGWPGGGTFTLIGGRFDVEVEEEVEVSKEVIWSMGR